MKQLLLSLFLVPVVAYSCPEHEGTWRSSKEETIEFTKKWVNVERKTMEFYSQIFGLQEIEFYNDKFVIEDVPKRKITIDGNEYDWGGAGESVPYELLGCTTNQVVIKYSLYGLEWIEVLNFINKDKYWVYTGSPNLYSSHTREFYVRKNAPNKILQPSANAPAE